jgi:signal transduction histidine kinase
MIRTILLLLTFCTLFFTHLQGQSKEEFQRMIEEKYDDITENSWEQGRDSIYFVGFEEMWTLLQSYLSTYGFDEVYNTYAMAYSRDILEKKPQLSLQILEENIAHAMKKNDFSILNNNYHEIAVLYQRFGDLERAAEYYLKSNALFKKSGDFHAYGYSLIDLGNFYYANEQFSMAKYYYDHAFKVFSEHLNGKHRYYSFALYHNNVGLVFMELNQVDSALYHFRKSFNIRKLKDESKAYYSLSYLYYIRAFHAKGMLDSCEYYFEKALQNQKENKVYDEMISTYLSYGGFRHKYKQYNDALIKFKKALELINKHQFQLFKTDCYFSLATLYYDMNKLDSSLFFYLKADSIGHVYGQKSYYNKISQALIKVYRKMGDFESALTHYDAYVEDLKAKVAFDKDRKDIQIQLKDRKKEDDFNAFRADQNRKIIATQAIILLLFLALVIVLLLSSLRIRKHSKALKETIQHRDLMISIIGHDLRGPLGTVTSTLDMIEQGLVEKDRFEPIIYAANQGLKSAYILLENLLDWANYQSKHREVARESISLKEVMKDAHHLLAETAKNKRIHLQTDWEYDYQVYADRNMIFAVFRNLISNAIKFSHEEQEIIIRANQVKGFIRITVQDFGVGMNKATVEKILALQRLDSKPGTKREKGSGLGLMIVCEFILKNKGHFEIESEPDKGTSFHIYLPTEA